MEPRESRRELGQVSQTYQQAYSGLCELRSAARICPGVKGGSAAGEKHFPGALPLRVSEMGNGGGGAPAEHTKKCFFTIWLVFTGFV